MGKLVLIPNAVIWDRVSWQRTSVPMAINPCCSTHLLSRYANFVQLGVAGILEGLKS